MVVNSINERKWVSTALNKLTNFLKRAPLWTVKKNSERDFGVYIKFDDKTLFYPYDCSQDVKNWIHHIKEDLVKYYPRLIEDIVEEHILTPAEHALYIEKHGGDIENIPTIENRVIKQNCWRIDKVLLHKNIFILYLEGSIMNPHGDSLFLPAEEPIFKRFKYEGLSVLFMKKLRTSTCDAETSKDFFENTIPLNTVKVTED